MLKLPEGWHYVGVLEEHEIKLSAKVGGPHYCFKGMKFDWPCRVLIPVVYLQGELVREFDWASDVGQQIVRDLHANVADLGPPPKEATKPFEPDARGDLNWSIAISMRRIADALEKMATTDVTVAGRLSPSQMARLRDAFGQPSTFTPGDQS